MLSGVEFGELGFPVLWTFFEKEFWATKSLRFATDGKKGEHAFKYLLSLGMERVPVADRIPAAVSGRYGLRPSLVLLVNRQASCIDRSLPRDSVGQTQCCGVDLSVRAVPRTLELRLPQDNSFRFDVRGAELIER